MQSKPRISRSFLVSLTRYPTGPGQQHEVDDGDKRDDGPDHPPVVGHAFTAMFTTVHHFYGG